MPAADDDYPYGVVYWLETSSPTPTSRHELVPNLDELLKRTEALRQEGALHVAFSIIPNPSCVGKPGVDIVGADYNWTKRREPATGRAPFGDCASCGKAVDQFRFCEACKSFSRPTWAKEDR